MKRISLLMFAGLISAAFSTSTVMAQNITSTTFGVQSVELDGYDSSFHGLFRVSDNGEYAVSSDESDSYAGILWQRSTNDITFVNDYTGEKVNGVILTDVANDGMMVGAYPALVTPEDGSSSYYCWHPGYKYIDGEWVDLPLPENTNLKYPMDMDYCSFAKRVSSDGRVIMGEVYLTEESRSIWQPMLWYLDENGNVTGTKTFEDLEYGNQGFIPYDMTDDGSIIVGWESSVRGDILPAMIKDGELITFAAPVLEWNGVRWAEYDENGNEKESWWEGLANCIDKEGNVYYYYFDGDGKQYNYVENVYTGEKTAYDNIVACGTGGVVLGMSTVIKSDVPFDLGDLYTALNLSDDATVIAGGGYGVEVWGEAFNYPELVMLSETPITSGIKTMKLDGIGFNLDGNALTISGDYDKAEVINTAGQTVGSGKGTLDMSGLTNGIYIVRITKGNKSTVYKILK